MKELDLGDQRERLRHPLERRISIAVALVGALLAAVVLGLLFWGTEWLETYPSVAKYENHAHLLMLAVLGAPVISTWVRRKRWRLAQDDSIRIDATQLPRLHAMLVSHCQKVGLAVPALYVSDGIEQTTSFSWRHRNCIILSSQELSRFSEGFDEIVEFILAREVGCICLGHTSFGSEFLKSFVARVPFLRAPLDHVRTYSRDRYGAALAPHALGALLVTVCGDRMLADVHPDAYFAQMSDRSERTLGRTALSMFRKRAPLARRIQQLRQARLLEE